MRSTSLSTVLFGSSGLVESDGGFVQGEAINFGVKVKRGSTGRLGRSGSGTGDWGSGRSHSRLSGRLLGSSFLAIGNGQEVLQSTSLSLTRSSTVPESRVTDSGRLGTRGRLGLEVTKVARLSGRLGIRNSIVFSSRDPLSRPGSIGNFILIQLNRLASPKPIIGINRVFTL